MHRDPPASDYASVVTPDTQFIDVREPDEVAQVARFLALDAPASMTGAVLDVNGASYVR